ncbi:MAG: hypothetical protein P8018_06995 [Acidobacteriota bacterium]
MTADVRETLLDLARGTVQRSLHDLNLEGHDFSADLAKVLKAEGYRKVKIRDLDIPRRIRYPAFYLEDGKAWFGYVFQEKFTSNFQRTVFASVVKNEWADWAVVLTRRHKEKVWVDLEHGMPFDEDYPSNL